MFEQEPAAGEELFTQILDHKAHLEIRLSEEQTRRLLEAQAYPK